jgi:pantothenate kinase
MTSERKEQERIKVGADLSMLLERLAHLARGHERVIVGVVGAPGVGKSTLADDLAARLGAGEAVVMPMDGFHLASPLLVEPGQLQRRGAIDTFDVGGYLSLLARVRSRTEEIVYAPGFDRKIEEPIAGFIPIHRDVPIVITEGNYLLSDAPGWNGIRSFLDETWYLEIDSQRRRERLVARHMRFGKTTEDAHAIVNGSDEHNAEEIGLSQFAADLVIRLI